MPLDAGPENKNNVIPFPLKEPPPETPPHIPSENRHSTSLQILLDEGFASKEEAESKLINLRLEKDEMMLSFTEKIKDKIFNHGESAQQVAELEQEIDHLSRLVKMVKSTEPKGDSAMEKAA